MAVTSTPVLPQTPKIGLQNFVEGTDSAGTYKTLYTGGSNGSKITAVLLTSDDSSSHTMTLAVTRGGVNYGLAPMPVASHEQLIVRMVEKGLYSGSYRVTGMYVDKARNAIVRAALANGEKWLLFVDADMVVPDDAAERLRNSILLALTPTLHQPPRRRLRAQSPPARSP